MVKKKKDEPDDRGPTSLFLFTPTSPVRRLMTWLGHKRIDETLASLDDGGGDGGVPRLPGTERRINSANGTLESGVPRVRQGPCADEGRILEKFHRCFSDALGPLY